MIQMVDKPNTTPIDLDRKTLTFKTLLSLSVAVHAEVNLRSGVPCIFFRLLGSL